MHKFMNQSLHKIKFWMADLFLVSLRAFHLVPHVFGTDRSIQMLLDHKDYSLARFGDGEFRWAANIQNNRSFQKNDSRLSLELRHILKDPNPKIFVAIPNMFGNPGSEYVDTSVISWALLWHKYLRKWKPLLSRKSTYLDANLSRLYIDRRKKEASRRRFMKIAQLWNSERVLIVEGESTLLGVKNNLLDKAKEVVRIEVPAIDAYAFVDEIEHKIRESSALFDVCILAIGPTATVLVNRLSDLQQSFYDLGHFDLEYEWMLMKAKERSNVGGRFVNEIREDSVFPNTIWQEDESRQVIGSVSSQKVNKDRK